MSIIRFNADALRPALRLVAGRRLSGALGSRIIECSFKRLAKQWLITNLRITLKMRF